MHKGTQALVQDFYELTMAQGYFDSTLKDDVAVFDLFFREVPDEGGYVVSAGLFSVIEYLQNLRFDEDDLAYLKKKGVFSEAFLEYLRDFRFRGNVYALAEGTIVFPYEPILSVKANIIEAQLIESFLLLSINHQSLIATKGSRVKRAARGRKVMEFGTRRAHGPDASVLGARAAYIGGVDGTSSVKTDQLYGVPALGTMAHSWVQMFDDEYASFKRYCEVFPHQSTLLVDTYDVLKSGVPNAIKAIKEVLLPKGIDRYAVRIDSGDLAYLSKQARKMLDEAGLENCRIVVSNSLDEHTIDELLDQEAKIDAFGVGERLITAKSNPVLGGVYKLVSVFRDGKEIPKIKVSENPDKITTPAFKQIYRIYDLDNDMAIADLITLRDETIDESKPLTIFDPLHTWKQKTLENFYVRPLLNLVIEDGNIVDKPASLEDTRQHAKEDLARFWEEIKRFEVPHPYYVDLSEKLWKLKDKMLKENTN